MKKHLFEGLIAAPFTPMDEGGNINPEPIGRYVDHLAGSGVTGAFVCGTTGESPSLTTEERKAILEEWMRHSRGKLKIICHVGGNSLPQSIDLARHAASVGADATGAFSPFFFKPSTAEDLLDFLAPIAGAAPEIPFYYYNIPSMTGVSLPVVQVLEKAKSKIPNFAGVKYTHFDLYDMQQSIAYGNGEFQIFHGYDEMLLAGLSFGVKSAVGSTYNYMPSVYLKLWEAFNLQDMESARKWQQVSVRAVQILNKYGGGVRAGKAIMDLAGISCGPCRLPIGRLTEEETASLKRDLEAMDFFALAGKKEHV